MKRKFLLSLFLVSVFTAFVFAQDNVQYFKVEADAIVKVNPDKVLLDVGVLSKGKSLSETKRKNADIIRNTIEYCKKLGIQEKNIQTDYLNIRPEYKNYDTYETHFIVEQRLSIILEDLSKYDEVLTGILNLGINKVNNVSFYADDMKKHKNEARKLAIAAAKERAQYLSKEAGIKLGNIINLSDVSRSWYYGASSLSANIVSQAVSDNADFLESVSTDTLAPGMLSVRANIILTYEIKK